MDTPATLDISLYTAAKAELSEMERIAEQYKGDKTPLERKISTFKRLLEAYRSVCIDNFVKMAEIERNETALILGLGNIEAKERELNDRKRFIDDWGGEMSTDQLNKLILHLDNKGVNWPTNK